MPRLQAMQEKSQISSSRGDDEVTNSNQQGLNYLMERETNLKQTSV